MKKLIAAVSTLFIAVALSIVAVAGPAAAHTAVLSGATSCNNDGSGTIVWTITNDYPETLNVTASDNATIIPVGTTVDATSGSGDTHKTFTQNIPAPAGGVSVTTTLSFLWSGDNFTQSNTKDKETISSDCKVPTPKDASANLVFTPATCTAPESVSEGTTTFASWAGAITFSGSGNLHYSATANATSGHLFSGGANTLTLHGNLDGPVTGLTCDNTTTKITICHATASDSNPYVSESVSFDSILPPSAGHGSAGVNAGDIIPPFDYVKGGVAGSYPGSNWDTAHQAIYNNGCKVPPPPVCIPNSSVTFHYSQNDANNGYITVTDVANSTGHLCHPFWVTATSWTFTNNSSVWPQNRDVVDKLGEISAPGTYDFAAQVTCGQGDIYASFDSSAPSLNPGPVLNGPSNPFVEHFLSDMGFSGSATPTYTQDSANCFIPTPETGTPVSTVLSCTPDTSNTLTLPSVPGGVWTVTSANYNHTYAIGTGVTGFVPTFFEQYTIVLSDGSSVDGYVVTGNTNHWTPVNPTSLDCNTTTTPEKPTSVAITQCGMDGSITIPDITGVVYSLDGNVVPAGVITPLSGTRTVTAAAAPGYEFPANTTTSWTFYLNDKTTCPVATVVGTCTADGNVSSVPVSVTLNNQSGSVSSSFEVKIEGTSYDQTFVVPAHTTVDQSIGSSSTAGETIDVFVNGSTTAVVLTVDKFDGCIPATPGDPTFTPLTCTGTTPNLGSISTDGNPGLTYTLYDGDNTTLHTPVSTFPGLPDPTIDGLVAGTYFVHVVANPGFVLSGTVVFPVQILLASVNCIGTEQTPVVTFVNPTCTPNPENNIESSGFTAALAEVQGTITIPDDSLMSFTISDGTTTTPAPTGEYIEPDGTYTVVATLKSTAIAEGYTFGASADYTRSAGDTVATFGAIEFTSECGLPTLASWHSGAVGTPAVCTLTGGDVGTITLVHGSDIAHATNEDGKVTYTLVNLGNSHTTDLGSSALTVSVAPGSYEIKAVPTDPADGLIGNPNVTNEIDYFVTIAAAAAVCDGNLAFTGGTIGWLGFALAGGMLFLGIAFLLMRRRQNRIAE
jgi:hypothetical protein